MKTLFAFLIAFAFAQSASAEQTGIITVKGEGLVEVVPDMATVSLGVQHQADTAMRALALVGKDITKITRKLAEFGVEERDIQTTNLALHQVYDRRNSTNQPPKVIGFSASNQLKVTVRDLDRIAEILDGIFDAGANNFNGISFGSSSPADALTLARQKAVRDALDRAATYATAATLNLGQILEISESGPTESPLPVMRAEMLRADSIPISAGTTGISVQIWLRIQTEAQ